MVDVPAIDTERLTLRGYRLDEFGDSAALWADPEVTRHISGGRTFNEEESWTRFLRFAGHWAMLGFGYWVARERTSGLFVGEVGFADYKRDIVPSFDGAPEAGWVLSPAAHGRGFATEAVRAILAWGEHHFGTPRSVCIIRPSNLASIRVAEKCGYGPRIHTTYQGQPTILFER